MGYDALFVHHNLHYEQTAYFHLHIHSFHLTVSYTTMKSKNQWFYLHISVNLLSIDCIDCTVWF